MCAHLDNYYRERGAKSARRLLELLDAGLQNVTTLEAEYRDQQARASSLSLIARSGGGSVESSVPIRLRWDGPGPFDEHVYLTRRVWLRKPDRLKVELRRAGTTVSWGVRDGARWSQWDMTASESSGIRTGDASTAVPPLLDPPLLTPVRLLGWLRVTELGSGRRAHRDVVTASAIPRELSSAWHRGRHYELELDAEHGTILRFAEFDSNDCVHLTEVNDIAYGRRLGPEVFRPPGTP